MVIGLFASSLTETLPPSAGPKAESSPHECELDGPQHTALPSSTPVTSATSTTSSAWSSHLLQGATAHKRDVGHGRARAAGA
ncbi:unnamed protein product [Parajaminaea phylloscopi]